MKVVIPGGSGHLGTLIARAFHQQGDEVVVLSRATRLFPWRTVLWDGRTIGPWVREIEGADAVVNLAGSSVHSRYDAATKREIVESRVVSTRIVGEAIKRASHPPRVWLQASTATIYAHRYDEANDERTGMRGGHETDAPPEWRFSIDVATAWEAAIDAAIVPHTRKINLRTSIVMSAERGGAFDQYLRLVRFGLGGRHGDGRQYVSWIHAEDFVRVIRWLIERDDVSGVVNLAAPEPLPNAEFLAAIRDAWGTRIALPFPEWLLRIALPVYGAEPELLLKSRRVVSRRLVDLGFRFQFPAWPDAARDLVAEWRTHRGLADSRRIDAPSY
jgi:uncharacterized protein (TIGR01777 family)